MVLIQLLLPTRTSRAAGMRPCASELSETRRELADTFKGLTAYLRSPAKGVWIASDGQKEEDDVVMFEVVTTDFDRTWWKEYAGRLATRFGQETIHVRAFPIEMLDQDAI